MATDSFTSTAAAVTTGTSTLSDPGGSVTSGYRQNTPRGWRLTVTSGGVSLLKAATLGGTYVTPTWPVTLEDARDLVAGLLKVTA